MIENTHSVCTVFRTKQLAEYLSSRADTTCAGGDNNPSVAIALSKPQVNMCGGSEHTTELPLVHHGGNTQDGQ